jgi:hypothetical protein
MISDKGLMPAAAARRRIMAWAFAWGRGVAEIRPTTGSTSGNRGLCRVEQLRRTATIARAHIIAWRKDMEQRKLKPATIRRKLSESLIYDLPSGLLLRDAVYPAMTVPSFSATVNLAP